MKLDKAAQAPETMSSAVACDARFAAPDKSAYALTPFNKAAFRPDS